MYIRRLTIEHLRSFEQAEIAFQYRGRPDGAAALPNVNLLLGGNGSGKSTVLKAVALATLAPVIQSAGFQPSRLVRRASGQRSPYAAVRVEVELHPQDTGDEASPLTLDEVGTRIESIRDDERIVGMTEPVGHWERMFDDQSPAFLMVGYGASRRVESASRFDDGLRTRSRALRYERVAGLFQEGVTLTPLGVWLPRLRTENSGRFTQVVNLIDRLLPDECRFTAETEGDDYLFEMRDARVPLAALSDGHRAYIGWIADLLYHIAMGAPSGAKLVDNRGVVLVDEIDLHLHPEWQRSVVPRLAEVLPNLQFVLTTHSPIVAGTLEWRNIFVMDEDETGASTVAQVRESIHGRSAEQILLSPYFDLDSTRAVAAEAKLAALSYQASAGDSEAALAFMKTMREGLGIGE